MRVRISITRAEGSFDVVHIDDIIEETFSLIENLNDQAITGILQETFKVMVQKYLAAKNLDDVVEKLNEK